MVVHKKRCSQCVHLENPILGRGCTARRGSQASGSGVPEMGRIAATRSAQQSVSITISDACSHSAHQLQKDVRSRQGTKVATYLHQQLAIGQLVKGSNSFGQLEGVEERQQGDLLRSRHLPESAGTSKMPQSALEFLLRLRRLISQVRTAMRARLRIAETPCCSRLIFA